MNHSINKIATNSIFNIVARVSELISGIITTILATRYLSVIDFGEFAFIGSLALALSPLIAFGSLRILIREISIEEKKADVFLSSGLILNGFMSIVACIVAILVAFTFHLTSTAVAVLYLALIAQLLLVMTNTIGALFIAYEKMFYNAAITSIIRLLTIMFFFIAIYYDLGVTGLFIALTLASAMGLLSTALILVYKFTKYKLHTSVQNLVYLFKESSHLAIFNFLYQGFAYINVFILKTFWDMVQVSFFLAPQRIIAPLSIILNSFLFAIVPNLSRLGHNDDANLSLQYAYSKIMKYLLIFTLPVCTYATVDATRLVSILFGNKFSEATISFQILIWTIVPLFINGVLSFFLTSIKKQKVQTISGGFCFITNGALGFILIQNYGHIGASIATLASCIVLFMFNFYFTSKYLIFIPIHNIILQPIFACSIMYFLLLSLLSELNIALSIISAFLVYFAVLFFSKTFTSDEIDIFKIYLQKFTKQSKRKI